MLETTVFIIGMFLFLAASTLFSALKKKNKKLASINMMISFVTLTSYAVLISGLGTVLSLKGQLIYPTRWLFYTISCSLLMYEIGTILKKERLEMIEMIFFNIIVMLTGYLASITLGAVKWIFFSISTVAFISNLLIIFQKQKKPAKLMQNVKIFVLLTWTLFPIGWLLGPTGIELLNPCGAAVLYLLLDLLTKTGFGYYLIKNA